MIMICIFHVIFFLQKQWCSLDLLVCDGKAGHRRLLCCDQAHRDGRNNLRDDGGLQPAECGYTPRQIKGEYEQHATVHHRQAQQPRIGSVFGVAMCATQRCTERRKPQFLSNSRVCPFKFNGPLAGNDANAFLFLLYGTVALAERLIG